jgi:hypothetical protein
MTHAEMHDEDISKEAAVQRSYRGAGGSVISRLGRKTSTFRSLIRKDHGPSTLPGLKQVALALFVGATIVPPYTEPRTRVRSMGSGGVLRKYLSQYLADSIRTAIFRVSPFLPYCLSCHILLTTDFPLLSVLF